MENDRSIESYFADWEGEAFGFGYGTGEPHTLAALKAFFAAIGRDDSPTAYDYEKLEAAVGATVAWLLINILCKWNIDVIEYGTSPRYGWLTKNGEKLQAFLATKSVDELLEVCCVAETEYGCGPNTCNCGPEGYDEKRVCPNPFFPRRSV